MSFLDRFRRNRQQSVLPDEVKEYYQSERRQRRGVAIGLALLALLITIAVAAALFFGGRFIYNQVWGKDDSNGQDTTQSQNDSKDEDASENKPQDNQPEQQNPAPQPTPQPAPAPAPQPQPAPAPAPTTPSLGDSPMPRTGDEGM